MAPGSTIAPELAEWFGDHCAALRPKWDAALRQAKRDQPGKTDDELEAFVAENAKEEVGRLNAEINSMLTRTGFIVAAATLLVAAYTFKPNAHGAEGALTLALCLTVVSFIAALVPMRPPFLRAWREPYIGRGDWTLLATSQFKRWALDCYLCDRRTPVITLYKRGHSVAIPLLIIATVVTAYGLISVAFK